LTTADRFSVPDSGTNNFKAEAFNIHTLTYTGVVTFFTGGAVGFFQFFSLTIFGNSSATLFDITGDPALPAKQLGFIESRADNFESLGTLENIRLFINNAALFNHDDGLTLINSQDLRVIELIMFNFTDKNSTFITIDGDIDLAGKISGLTATAFLGESILDIRPNIGENSAITIEGCNFVGNDITDFLGVIFKVGVTGNITAIVDASMGTTSITSVEDSPDNPDVARFHYTGAAVFKFQKVSIIDFVTNTGYNITGILTKVGSGYFEISKIAWGSDEAVGTFTSASVIMTSATHGRSDGEGVQIKDSIRHDGGTYLYNAAADVNEFQVNIPFDTATETATWDTSSLDQTDPRVTSVPGNTGLDPSFTIGSFTVTDNMALMDFTGIPVSPLDGSNDASFIDFVFDVSTPAIIGTNAELFKLINPLNGEMKYLGQTRFKGTLKASISSVRPSGATVVYLFRAIVNGIDGAPISNEIKTTINNTGQIKDFVIDPGQTFKLQGANTQNTLGLRIRYLNVSVS
jgi:hypothetical protein